MRNAKQRGVTHAIEGTLESAGIAEIGSAGMFDVLEHIPDEQGILRAIHARMAPGGRLYIAVPAYQWLWSQEDDLAGHFRRYTGRTLRRAMESAGFRVEFQTDPFAPLPPPIFAIRSIPYRRGVRLPAEVFAERGAAEHGGSSLLNRVLELEAKWIGTGRPIWFGSSCLAVGTKATMA